MVPPEGIDKVQPTTLPADFAEWDGGAPETPPADFNEFERFPAPAAPPKPAQRAQTARVAVLPAVERPTAPPPRKAVKRIPDPEPVFQMPKTQDIDLSDLDENEGKGKRTKLFVAIGAGVVLVAAVAGIFLKSGSKPATPNQTVTQQMTETATTGAQAPPKPGTSATPAPTQAATTAGAAPQADTTTAKPSQMINSQLAAPSRISNDLRSLGANQAAPTTGFNPSGMDMGNGTGVFSQGNGPKVKVEAAKKMTISAGIAVGLLVQKTAPVYPPIAKSARISGTVVIQATISKTGSVQNLRVVSGPTMLRQAALDAVKSWRYRPYLLDGEPVEVDTTVNVVFNLGA